jgi:hypothetical protein
MTNSEGWQADPRPVFYFISTGKDWDVCVSWTGERRVPRHLARAGWYLTDHPYLNAERAEYIFGRRAAKAVAKA